MRTFSKDFQELSDQERADLRKSAQQQLELARRLDALEQGMQRMAQDLGEQDPLAADTLDDALDHARGSALSGQPS